MRSDIAKLVSQARNVWRQSDNYKIVKRAALVRTGWYLCVICKQEHEIIKIDHIEPVGKQPKTMREFGDWLQRLFCDVANLRAICTDCHKIKTKEERRKK